MCKSGSVKHRLREGSVSEVATIGWDIATYVFRAHSADGAGRAIQSLAQTEQAAPLVRGIRLLGGARGARRRASLSGRVAQSFERGLAQSAKRGGKNQIVLSCARTHGGGMDPIRRPPYRPSLHSGIAGRTHGRIQLLRQTSQKSLATKGTSTD